MPSKRVPRFRSEIQERAFWAAPERDSTAYLDWNEARLARFPNLTLSSSTRAISLRLPVWVFERIKLEANRRGVSYHSLIKVWLEEKVARK